MDSTSQIIDLITGGGPTTLLSLALIYMYRMNEKKDAELHEIRKQERDRMLADLDLYKRLAMKASE